MLLLAANMTYLYCLLTFSCHIANQVAVSSCFISFHWWPGGGGGTVAFLLTLMVICSGRTLFLTLPVFGCSPLPRKSPGGSTRKLPTFSLRPSQRQYR